MPAPFIPNWSFAIRNAYDWLTAGGAKATAKDVAQSPVRGFQRLGEGVVAIPKGVAMAGADLVEGAPLYGALVGGPAVWKDVRVDDQMMAFKRMRAQKSQQIKEASLDLISKAVDGGKVKIKRKKNGEVENIEVEPDVAMKLAQIMQDRMQPEPEEPDTATRIKAVSDSITGGNWELIEQRSAPNFREAWRTGKPDIAPEVSGDTTGWVKPQTAVGSITDLAVPLAWDILAGKALMPAPGTGSGLKGLRNVGTFFGGRAYPQSYATARSNPEVTPEAAHNYATTHAAINAFLPVLGMSRMGVRPLASGLELMGVAPETTKRAAMLAIPTMEAAVQTGLEGRAEKYIDPSASGWSWEGFLKNLGMQGGMSAIHGSYEAAKDATRKASPGIGEVGTDIDMVNNARSLEQQFQSLQGRQLAEKLSAIEFVKTINQSYGEGVGEQLQRYNDVMNVKRKGGNVEMPSDIDIPLMERIHADPNYSGFVKRLRNMHNETAGIKNENEVEDNPFYVPRAIMQGPTLELPNGPNQGGGLAKTKAGSSNERVYMALQDVGGGREVVTKSGNKSHVYDPETGEITATYKKSNLGVEAQPLINRMIKAVREVTGLRDKVMEGELGLMESRLNEHSEAYMKHNDTIDSLETKAQELTAKRDALSRELEVLTDPKQTEIYGNAESLRSMKLAKEIKKLQQEIDRNTFELSGAVTARDHAADLHGEAVTQLETKLAKIMADKAKDPMDITSNDPRTEAGRQAWNEAASEFGLMRKKLTDGDPRWHKAEVYKKQGAGRDWGDTLRRMTDATTAEIEGSTNNVYRKDALLNLGEASADVFGAHQGTVLLDNVITNPAFARKVGGEFGVPQGWTTPSKEVLDRAPMLRGHAFEPRINALFESMAQGTNRDGFLKLMGDIYMDLGFANPTVHWHNMIAHFVKAAGSDTFTPGGIERLTTNLERAGIAVREHNGYLQKFLEAGGTMMTRKGINQKWESVFKGQEDAATRNRMESEGLYGDEAKLTRENRPDMSDVGGSLTKAVKEHGLLKGLVQMPIASMNKNVTWKVDDQLRMALTMSYIEKHGMDMNSTAAWKKAVNKVNEIYPSYKNSLFRFEGEKTIADSGLAALKKIGLFRNADDTPISMRASSLLQKTVNYPLLNFMRYRTGAWESVIHSVASPVKNADKLAAMGLTALAGGALATPVIKTLSGDDKAEYRGGGPIHIGSQLSNLYNTYDLKKFAQGQAILRPDMQIAANFLLRGFSPSNRTDLWNLMAGAEGDQRKAIYENMGKQAAEDVLSPIMWGQDVAEATQGRGDFMRAAVLQLTGGSTAKTPAEVRMGMAQSNVLSKDDTSLEGRTRRTTNREAQTYLQRGDVKGLEKMLNEGRLTKKEYKEMLINVANTREEKLAVRLGKLTLDKATGILDKASPEEFNAAFPVMRKKVKDSIRNKTKSGFEQAITFFKGVHKRAKKGTLNPDLGFEVDEIEEIIQDLRDAAKEAKVAIEENVQDFEQENP